MSWLETNVSVSFFSFSCPEVAFVLFVFALFLVTDSGFVNKSFLSAVAQMGHVCGAGGKKFPGSYT